VTAGLTYDKLNPQIASDGAGGAIIVWEDGRNGTDFDIYAQRIDGTGTLSWSEAAVSTAIDNQLAPRLASDSAGGAFIVWEDYQGDPANRFSKIYGQHLNSSGAIATGGWVAGGVELAVAATDQKSPHLVSDGSGGAIVIWEDDNSTGASTPNFIPSVYQIYSQQIAADGTPLI